MEFRLTYQGLLRASKPREDYERQSRLKHMHDIRKRIHEQLSELWRLDPRLKWYSEKNIHVTEGEGETRSYSNLDEFSKKFERGGIKWAPLINDVWGVACSLDILFLRREPKGKVIQSGDLDNRIATLFDALRIPDENQIPDDLNASNEPNPFFCLLSDDKLIAEFRVTSDRLLVPSPSPQEDSKVHLVIAVRTFVADHDKARMTLGRMIHD